MNLSEISLISLLKNLNQKEIFEFEKFVSSPYFNSQKAIVNLLQEIIKFYPGFSDENFSKEKIFNTLFPDKDYNDTLFRKYMSNLMKLAEDFLVQKDISENSDRRITCLLDQFDKRNLAALFERKLKTYKKDLTNSKISVETFYYRHFREELKATFYIRTNKLYKLKSCLIKSHIYILMHLLLTNTVYSNMMLIVQKSFSDSEDNDYFKKFSNAFELIAFLENVKALDENEKIFVALCKMDCMIINNPFEAENLKSMKSLIFKLSNTLSDNLLYTFFSHLNIFYLMNIANNQPGLNNDLFENYKFMIEKGLYISDDKEFINFSEYRTILIISLKLNEFIWAEKFIHKYKDYHEPVMKSSIQNYSLALIEFEKKNFEKSLKLISDMKLNDLTMKMDLNVLQLMIYYELDYTDNALSLIDSYRHYLLENKILSKDVIKNQLNFLKYYRIVLLGKNKKIDDSASEKIKSEIITNVNIRRKDWLLEKLLNNSQ